MKTLDNLNGMTRAEVVPYYIHWILTKKDDDTFWPTMNKMIIEKWSSSGLMYIKNEAWKALGIMKTLSDNGYHITR